MSNFSLSRLAFMFKIFRITRLNSFYHKRKYISFCGEYIGSFNFFMFSKKIKINHIQKTFYYLNDLKILYSLKWFYIFIKIQVVEDFVVLGRNFLRNCKRPI